MVNPGDLVGGRYKIVRQLGAGSFGATYLTQDLHQVREFYCVVKHLQLQIEYQRDPSVFQNACDRFRIEAGILERLGKNHHRIPQLLAYIQERNQFYLVQEFIEGEDLHQELQRKECLSEEETIALLEDVLEILTFVHQNQAIHRDIKPSNLMRRKSDGRIVLIDFGAVKEIGTFSVDLKTKVLTASVIGTPGYWPPEQQIGKLTYSSDIYALGITAIQALTGRSPQEFFRDTAVLQGVASPDLAAILQKMVKLDYWDRYQGAEDVLTALKSVKLPQSGNQAKPRPFPPWYFILAALITIPSTIIITREIVRQNQVIKIDARCKEQLKNEQFEAARECYAQLDDGT